MSEETLFIEAIEIRDSAERAAFLDRACMGDAAVRGRLDRLLEQHERAGKFLASPAAAIGATGAFTPAPEQETAAAATREQTGTMIGPYKLLQQIGEGGMGTVFMAEQTEPVKRKVALKIIKAGMDSKQVIARFEAERQALAVMDHVNIARVLDAGTTESGLPYFVMELVHGIPITKYCDDNYLTPRERLELFVPVCQAIQHAHQKGIIHRDIKPSNVMITLYDGKPVPKVIDFGVAKAIEQTLTERTLFTQFGTMIGTFEYMSPEQAEMSALGVDTRSDIYSLGVLLYELLTGSTPLTHKRLEDAAYGEILRIIKEEEPPKPSTRLSESGEALASISAQRHMEPAKLAKLVRGELDWIVMKCLEKDRNRRYETANVFAADVQRYLADETVQACPPSAGYRLRKFVRRNRFGLAVAGLVLFFLVLLGSGAGWAWRDRTARAAERANYLEGAIERAELLHREGKRGEVLAALERAHLLAREATPPPLIAERIESLQQLLDADGRDAAFVARFEAFRRDVQTEVDLEKRMYSASFPKFRDALEQYGIAPGVTPPATAAAHIQKRPAAVQTVVIAALDHWLQAASTEDSSGTPEWLIEVLQKADSDPWRSKVRQAWQQPAALAALAKDVDVRQQPPSFLLSVAAALPSGSPVRLELSRRVQFAYPGDFWANHGLGWDLDHVGKDAEAVRYYTAALALRPDNPGVLLNRSEALKHAGELDSAIADLLRAIAVSPRYSDAYINFGLILCAQKKLDEAIDNYRIAIKIDPRFPLAYANLGLVLHQQRRLPEAIDAYRTAIELGPIDAKIHNHLAAALNDCKKPGEAVVYAREALKLDPKFAAAHVNLGNALHALGKLDEAIAAFREAIDIDPKRAKAHNNLGALLCDDLKDYEKAIECFRKAIAIDPAYASPLRNLSFALTQMGWALVNSPDPKRRDPKRGLEAVTEAAELTPKSDGAWQYLGWVQYRIGNWRASIESLGKACKLQKGGTGDAAQWTVLALAHARLAAQDDLPEKERSHHKAEARRWFDQADKQIDSEWRSRPEDTFGQAIWDFRAEARELMGVKKK